MNDFWSSTRVLWSFAGHVLVSVIFFAVIASGIVGLHFIGLFLVREGVDAPYLWVMHALEGLLFIADIAVTSFWIVISTRDHLEKMRYTPARRSRSAL